MTKFNIGDRVRLNKDCVQHALRGKTGTVKRVMDNEGYCQNLYLLDMDEPFDGAVTYNVTKYNCGLITVECFLEYEC